MLEYSELSSKAERARLMQCVSNWRTYLAFTSVGVYGEVKYLLVVFEYHPCWFFHVLGAYMTGRFRGYAWGHWDTSHTRTPPQ